MYYRCINIGNNMVRMEFGVCMCARKVQTVMTSYKILITPVPPKMPIQPLQAQKGLFFRK